MKSKNMFFIYDNKYDIYSRYGIRFFYIYKYIIIKHYISISFPIHIHIQIIYYLF